MSNHTTHDHKTRATYPQSMPSTSSLDDDGGLRNRSMSRVFWPRQLSVSVQTVTVTLTVTNTVSPSPVTATIDTSELSPTLTSSFPDPSTNTVSGTPTPPQFVTATDPRASTSTLTLTGFSSIAIPSNLPTSTALNPPASASNVPTIPTPTSLPTSTSSLQSASPTLINSNPITSTSNTTGKTNSSSSQQRDTSQSSDRFLIPFIIILIICGLGLILSFLACVSPHLRQTSIRQKAQNDTIVEDYNAYARTFDPNPLGGLNYQRSLSRKLNRKLNLIDPTDLPNDLEGKKFDGDSWLPQTSTGPDLTRTA